MMTKLLVFFGFLSVGLMGAILVRPFFKDANPIWITLDKLSRLGWVNKIAILFIVVQLTMFGGAKHGGTNDVDDVTGTNQVEIVGGGGDTNEVGGIVLNALQPMFNGAALLGGCGPLGTTAPTVTVRPYRLESVSTNEGYSYAMPAGGAIRGTWHLTGAYEDVIRVGIRDQGSGNSGWSFPLGNNLCTSLWAYTWGKVRPQFKNVSNEIAAVGAPMSAIPDVSRFWTMATTNDTYLLTWENFAASRVRSGEDAASPFLNAQIELFRNGDFITRSNEVECVYRRVIEPNPIVDPVNPPDPDDPSKPLYPYGPVQNLSVIEETNAYCWVDIVVNTADAWVYFEGDGTSNLADPSFAAKAGETNHVVILIGKTYKVTCDMPFTVVGKSDPSIDEWWEDGNTLWLNWPVNIWSVGDDEEPPLLLMSFGNGSPRRKGFTMFVSPSGLGGGFTWTNCCCSVSGSGYYFSYNCAGDCGCSGCSATGYFGYEGYRLSASGGSCGCGSPEEPHDPHDDSDDPPVPVGVSASFSKRVIFLENEYANTTNEVVPWYSDMSSLCCTAWGGENGGHVSISIVGDSNLIQYGGQPFPIERDLEPYEVFAFTNTYKAVSESSGYEAIVVTATFDENDTDWSETSIAKATAVRVEVEAVSDEPECKHRHVYGVGERVYCKSFPENVQVQWSSDISGAIQNVFGVTLLECPFVAMPVGLTASCNGCAYGVSMTLREPEAIHCSNAIARDLGLSENHAGGVGLDLELYIEPTTVSFYNLAIQEIPAEGSHEGYFNNLAFTNIWNHSKARRAGVWKAVSPDNFYMTDEAHLGDEMPRVEDDGTLTYEMGCGWSGGRITWPIPMGWQSRDACETDLPELKRMANLYQQVFRMTAEGTASVEKHGYKASRGTNDVVWLERGTEE